MLLFPNEFHKYYPLSDPWSVHWFSFNGFLATNLLQSLHFNRSLVLHLSDPQPPLSKMGELIQLSASDISSNYRKCSTIIYDIILDLQQYGSAVASRPRQPYLSQLSPAIRYIEERFHQPISLEQLAAQLAVSRQHTCALFQQTLGLRPMEYINKIRIDKARELLVKDFDRNIADVAVQVGFENLSYFIKVFKRHLGVTPRKYREALKTG